MIITKGYRSSVQRLFRILTTSQCTTSIALQTWRKHFNFTKSRPTLEVPSIIDHCKLNTTYWQQVWKSLFSIRQLRDLIGKGGEGWGNKSSLQPNSLLIFSACTESKIILRRRQHTKPANIEFRQAHSSSEPHNRLLMPWRHSSSQFYKDHFVAQRRPIIDSFLLSGPVWFEKNILLVWWSGLTNGRPCRGM